MSLRLGQGPTSLSVRLDRGNATTLSAVKDGGQEWGEDVVLEFTNSGNATTFTATVDGHRGHGVGIPHHAPRHETARPGISSRRGPARMTTQAPPGRRHG